MWSENQHYPYMGTYSAPAQSTYVPSITRGYSSLENALGPDAPWLKPPDQDTMASEGGSRPTGTQYGSHPNRSYNSSHNGGETSNIAIEPPAETIEQLLGEAPVAVPHIEGPLSAPLPNPDEDEMATTSIEPSSERVSQLPYSAPATGRPSLTRCQLAYTLKAYIDDKGYCNLRNGTRFPCGKLVSACFPKVYTTHLVYAHIANELSLIRSGQLDIEEAEILNSERRVNRAESYQWRCPVPDCHFVTFRGIEMERHYDESHPNMPLPPAERQGRDLNSMTLISAVSDILAH
jgi:hypothetical protein